MKKEEALTEDVTDYSINSTNDANMKRLKKKGIIGDSQEEFEY